MRVSEHQRLHPITKGANCETQRCARIVMRPDHLASSTYTTSPPKSHPLAALVLEGLFARISSMSNRLNSTSKCHKVSMRVRCECTISSRFFLRKKAQRSYARPTGRGIRTECKPTSCQRMMFAHFPIPQSSPRSGMKKWVIWAAR